jgi:DNA polymerase III epsilon subunit-like protein
MHTLHLKKPLAFFDLETTGVNIVRDRIVEISVVKALVNGETEIRTRRINPEMPIPLESSLIHGIYDEDIKDAPTFKSVAKTCRRSSKGATWRVSTATVSIFPCSWRNSCASGLTSMSRTAGWWMCSAFTT